MMKSEHRLNNMNSGIQVFSADSSDWADYRRLRINMLTNEQHAFGPTPEGIDKFYDDHWKNELSIGNNGIDSRTFIARQLGTLTAIGMAGVYNHTSYGMFIGRMYVEPEYRGLGVGSDLLTSAENFARQLGSRGISLWVKIGNIGAKNWYLNSGYTLPSDELVTQEDDSGMVNLLLVKQFK